MNPLGGIPPEAWLSGLPLGILLGGEDQPSMSGSAGAQDAGSMAGGLSLAELQQLMAPEAEPQVGPGTGGSLFGGLGQFSLGQAPGYIGAGGLPQGTPNQPSQGYGRAGGTQGQEDPLAQIRAALGLGGKVLDLGRQLGRSTGYATAGGQGSEIDPTGFSLTEEGGTASPTAGLEGSLTGAPLNDPTLGMLFTQGLLSGSIDPNWVSSLSPDDQKNLLASLMTNEEGPLLNASDFNLDVGGLRGYETPGRLGTSGSLGTDSELPGTDLGGVASGGLHSALGLLNLIQGLQTGNPGAIGGGGLSTLSGLTSALQSSPELANALGLSGATLGAAGTGLGGLGGILGLYGGAQSAAEGNVPGATVGLGQGGLSTYTALQTLFPGIFPEIGSVTAGLGGAGAGAGAAGLAGGEAAGLAGLEGAALGGGAGAAAGTGAGIGAATGASIAGAVAWPLLPVALGIALHPFFEEWDQPGLGKRHEMRNNLAAGGLSNSLVNAITRAETPADFLNLAAMGPRIGQGQTEFTWNGFSGGDYDTPMAPEYAQALQRAAMGGPAGISDFIKGFNIAAGPTGQTTPSDPLTDYYRREMAHAAGLTNVQGLFSSWNPAEKQARSALGNNYLETGGNWERAIPTLEALLSQGVSRYQQPVGPGYGYLNVPVSQYYRSPHELSGPPELRGQMQALLDSLRRDLETQRMIAGMAPGTGGTVGDVSASGSVGDY